MLMTRLVVLGPWELAVKILVPFGCLGMCLIVNKVPLHTFESI